MTKEELKKTKLADIAHLRNYNHDSLYEDDYDMIWACIDNLLSSNERRRKALEEIASSYITAWELRNIAQAALGEGEKE